MGLDEDKLYKISKKEFLENHPELRQEKSEFQNKKNIMKNEDKKQ